MPFIREIQPLRRYSLPLKRCEQAYALIERNPEVELIVDDEIGSLEVCGILVRRKFIKVGRFPGNSVLPFIEPDLFGRAVHVVKIVDAVMRDQSLESVCVTLEPIHHVASK